MTAPDVIDPDRNLKEQPRQAAPDLTRSMPTIFINALMSTGSTCSLSISCSLWGGAHPRAGHRCPAGGRWATGRRALGESVLEVRLLGRARDRFQD